MNRYSLYTVLGMSVLCMWHVHCTFCYAFHTKENMITLVVLSNKQPWSCLFTSRHIVVRQFPPNLAHLLC